MKEYIIDINKLNKDEHKYLNEVFEFYTESNFDALYDVLTEQAFIKITILNIKEANTFSKTIYKIFEDVGYEFENLVFEYK